MQACLIQWPELVTCPSAQCIEESGRRGGGGSGGNMLTATLELEASATFSPQAAHVRQTHKKKAQQRAQAGRLVPRCAAAAC